MSMKPSAVILALAAVGTSFCVHAVASPPAKAGRSGFHGAMAFEARSGSFGYSYDYPSSRQAKEAALVQCANPRCIVIANFKNACAAIVQGPQRPFSSQGATREEAEARAMQKCNDGKRCKPVGWVCTK